MKYIATIVLFSILFITTSNCTYAQSGKLTPGINHVAIFVKNLKATKSFYEDVIGLDTIPEPFHDGKHAWYNLGSDVSMHVIEGATEKTEYYKNFSLLEILFYNVRHIQHHSAQLNLLLRQTINNAPTWVSQAQMKLGANKINNKIKILS